MASPVRLDFDGAWHHVMNHGRDDEAIFLTDNDRNFFLTLFDKATSETGIEVHAFCLMDNHYHALVHTPAGGLSDAFRLIGSEYALYFNQTHGVDGPLCRRRFHSVLIERESHHVRVVRYVHNNPVQAGRARTARDAQWTSHPAYLGIAETPGFLSTEVVLGWFGGDLSAFDRFVNDVHAKSALEIAAAIDSKSSKGTLTAALADLVGPFDERHPMHESVLALQQLICDATGAQAIISGKAKPGRRTDSALMLMTLLFRTRIATTHQLAQQFGYTSRSGVSSAISRFEKRIAENALLRDLLEQGLGMFEDDGNV